MILRGHLRAALLVFDVSLIVMSCSSGDKNPGAMPSAAPPAGESSWPMLAHDARSNFRNDAESLLSASSAPQLVQVWEFKTSGSVTGTPAIAGGRVYVLAGGGLYAFEASSGRVVWQNDAVKGTSSPTYADGKLYVNDGKSVLHRLDAATGAEEWRAKIDPHEAASGFSSPVVSGGRVIVGSASIEEVSAKDNATFRGSLVAFDAATGIELWRRYTVDPPNNGVAIWSTPSVDENLGLVYGTTGNNYTGDAGPTSDSIFALDLATGAPRWSRQLSQNDVFTIPAPKSGDSDFGTNPILFDAMIGGTQRKLLGAGQKSGMFWALDRITGEVVWSRKVSGGSALIGGVFNNGAYDGERIIVAGNNGASTGPGSEPSNGASKGIAAPITTSVLMAMSPADGAVLWERQLPAWVWAPITVTYGVGFVSADSEIQAFDTATGAKLFSLKTSGTIASGASIAGGRVYFGSGLGYIGTTFDNTLHALAVP